MAGITLEQAQAQLNVWLDASTTVAASQSYEISSGSSARKLTRADAAEIRQQVTFWQSKVIALTSAAAGGRRRVRYVVPE